METIKWHKGRVPRKLKKWLKKQPYFDIFGNIWIREIKWKAAQKDIDKYWGFTLKKTI